MIIGLLFLLAIIILFLPFYILDLIERLWWGGWWEIPLYFIIFMCPLFAESIIFTLIGQLAKDL